jgi:hypothetical protein
MSVRFPLSISTTIFVAFVAMGLLTTAVGGYGLFVLRTAGGFVVNLYDRPLMAVNFDRAASLDFVEMDKELIRRSGSSDRDRAEIDARLDRLAKTFDEDLAVANERSLYGDEKALIKEIGDLVARWHALRLGGADRAKGSELDRLAARIIERFDLLAELALDHSFAAEGRLGDRIFQGFQHCGAHRRTDFGGRDNGGPGSPDHQAAAGCGGDRRPHRRRRAADADPGGRVRRDRPAAAFDGGHAAEHP